MGSLCINVDIIDHFSFRAVKASYSLAFAEVIVACEIINNESKHLIDDNNSGGKKTIYLHLKKYFRGTRFTCLPFLKKVEAKHKLGDVVCVSGKVSRTSPLDAFFFPCLDKGIFSCFHIVSSRSVSLSKGKKFVTSPITGSFFFFWPADSMKFLLCMSHFTCISNEGCCRLIYFKLCNCIFCELIFQGGVGVKKHL
jgi:hypothetical protein